MLARLGLGVLLHIHRLGFAVDALDVGLRLQVGLLHLQLHQATREGHYSDVVTGRSLNGHNVALLQGQVVVVVVVPLSGILELHFHQVGHLVVAGDVGQPVVGVELVVLPATAAAAKATASVV